MLITIDKDSKVYINIGAKKDPARLKDVIAGINTSPKPGLIRGRNAKFYKRRLSVFLSVASRVFEPVSS